MLLLRLGTTFRLVARIEIEKTRPIEVVKGRRLRRWNGTAIPRIERVPRPTRPAAPGPKRLRIEQDDLNERASGIGIRRDLPQCFIERRITRVEPRVAIRRRPERKGV